MNKSRGILITAGLLGILVALFQVVISFSQEWALYFGATKDLVDNYLMLVIVGNGAAAVFLMFALYALSGAGLIRPLPFLRLGLLVTGGIYTARGLFIIPLLLETGENQTLLTMAPETRLASCIVALSIGLLYLTGTISGWRSLPFSKNQHA